MKARYELVPWFDDKNCTSYIVVVEFINNLSRGEQFLFCPDSQPPLFIVSLFIGHAEIISLVGQTFKIFPGGVVVDGLCRINWVTNCGPIFVGQGRRMSCSQISILLELQIFSVNYGWHPGSVLSYWALKGWTWPARLSDWKRCVRGDETGWVHNNRIRIK